MELQTRDHELLSLLNEDDRRERKINEQVSSTEPRRAALGEGKEKSGIVGVAGSFIENRERR